MGRRWSSMELARALDIISRWNVGQGAPQVPSARECTGIGHLCATLVVVVDCSDGSAASCANVIDMRNGRAFCFSCDTTDEKTLNEKLLVPLGRLIQDKKIGSDRVIVVWTRPALLSDRALRQRPSRLSST